MRAFLLLSSFLACGLAFQAQAFQPSQDSRVVHGTARVIDGDTVAIGAQRIRFFGVDAPESTQVCDEGDRAWRCGAAARDMLAERIGPSRQVTCQVMDTDPYGRWIAVCFNTRGEDLNAWMVHEGLAVAYTRYSDAYAQEEDSARARGYGIWGGPFERPDAYRHRQSGSAGRSNYARLGNTDDGENAVQSLLGEGRSQNASWGTTPVRRPTMRGMACVVLHAGC